MRKMTHPAHYQQREPLLASLLLYRKTWQPLIRLLPMNTYLIVTSLDNPLQNASMLRLVQQLRWQGELVYAVGGESAVGF